MNVMSSIDEKLVSSLLGVMRCFQKPMAKHVMAEELTVSQFTVMEMLFHKGERTVNEIISGVFSTSGNISVVIDNLIAAGFLEKKVNPKDRRSRLVGLTQAGRDKMNAYYPKHKEELHRLMDGLSDAKKEDLIKGLLSLRKAIDKKNTQ